MRHATAVAPEQVSDDGIEESMGAVPLTDAVQRAQDAMSGGNYRLAAETCRRLLDQYPEYVVAHQLLGEAYLEQRQIDDAERAFQATLLRDPRNTAAYLGLGLIAEERRDQRAALAYMQVAWEIDPRRVEAREHVVRLAQGVYSPEGRLQLTRAGLSSLHASSGRWSRAVNECAATLAEYPDRTDVRLRLAEALWRRGEDDRAAATCQAVLERSPQAVVALLLLADIERRRGHADEARTLRERARAVDPDGAQASALFATSGDERVAYFVPTQVPRFEEDARPAVEPERPRIAPAPDFTAPEPEPERPAPVDVVVEPVAEAPAEAPIDAAAELSLPSDAELESARPHSVAPAGYTGLLRSLEGEGFEPFSAVDFGADALAGEPVPPAPAPEAHDAAPVAPASAPAFEPAAEAATEAVAPTGEADGLLGLSSDSELAAALPPEHLPQGYTTLLRSIEDDGLEPFSVEPVAATAPEPEEAALEDTLLVEEAAVLPQPVAPTSPPTSGLDAGEVVADWDRIDEEIRGAIPGEMPRGYTDQLRSLDDAGVEPFSFDSEEIPFFQRMKSRSQADAPPEPAPVAPPPPAGGLSEADLLEDLGDVDDLQLLDELPEEPVEGDLGGLSADDLAALESATQDVTGPAEAPTDPLPADGDLAELDRLLTEAATETPVVGADILSPEGAAERLGVGPELFDRARLGKEQLIAEGEVEVHGDVSFEPETAVEPQPVAEVPAAPEPEPPVVSEAAPETQAPAPVEVAPEVAAVQPETKPEPAATEAEIPSERLAAAAALAERGAWEDALEQCRWLQRHAPDLTDALIPLLGQLTIDESTVAAGAHRLLGAIYRRRGQVQLASNHYSQSLSAARHGGKRD